MSFGDRLAERVKATVPCCVGIDPHMAMLPFDDDTKQHNPTMALKVWCDRVIDAVCEAQIPVVKPQSAFFEAFGSDGVRILESVVDYAQTRGLIVLLDAKRGDIGSTAEGYIQGVFGRMKADAVTLNPYLGPESLEPWRQYIVKNSNPVRGAFVLVRTSNPGAKVWQGDSRNFGSIAVSVSEWINEANVGPGLGPFGAVVGATLPKDELAMWRRQMPNTWFLLPGYGAQGAKAVDCKAGFREDGIGGLVVSARDVLFPARGETETDWEAGLMRRAKAFADDIRTIL